MIKFMLANPNFSYNVFWILTYFYTKSYQKQVVKSKCLDENIILENLTWKLSLDETFVRAYLQPIWFYIKAWGRL